MQKKHVFVLLLSIVVLTSLLVLHIQGRISVFNGNDPILVVSTDGFLNRVNETIKICLRIVNPTFSPMTFHFSSGYQFDFAISKNSIVIYRWSADKLFIQMLTRITIPPLSSVTRCYSHRPQDCFLGPGIYQVSGYLVGYGGASTTIVVI